MSNTVGNDVKKFASLVENLAKELQVKLDSGADIMATANELVRNQMTLVFTLGEFYANTTNGTPVKATTVSNPSGTKSANYHNLRDSRGRFARKV